LGGQKRIRCSCRIGGRNAFECILGEADLVLTREDGLGNYVKEVFWSDWGTEPLWHGGEEGLNQGKRLMKLSKECEVIQKGGRPAETYKGKLLAD